jgi:hypothetical protein
VAAEEVSHRLGGALIGQQLVLLKVEHSRLHAGPVLHARADTSRELSLRRLPAPPAAQQREPVLGHSQARRHDLDDLLTAVAHDPTSSERSVAVTTRARPMLDDARRMSREP